MARPQLIEFRNRDLHFGSHSAKFRLQIFLHVASLVLLTAGCSTHAKRLQSPRQHFYGNDFAAAHAELVKLSEKRRSDHTVAELDLAVIELLDGQPESAEHRLRDVRDRWQELEGKSLADEAQSLVTDDQKRQYSGDPHEQLMIGVFLTLASLMRDGVDAEAYTLQTIARQQKFLEQANENRDEPLSELFGVPPIAPYLRGVLRESTLHDYDDAQRMYQLTADLMPEHAGLLTDIERAGRGVHSQPEHGVVYVIGLVGRGPYKVEKSELVTQAVMLQAGQIVSMLGKYSVPPTLAPIKIPALECPPKMFDLIGVEVDGQPTATTLPITDLDRLARETYEAQLPRVMARTVARRIVKKGAVVAAKHQMQANSAASLAMDVVGVAWEATESADTRCWGLLPREIQLVRLELPCGRHDLALEPITSGRPVGAKTHCSVEVQNARNSYVLGYWPDNQPVGRVVANTP